MHDFASWSDSINAAPDDANLLLVFADWLEENGFADAAGWRELGTRRVKLWHAPYDDSWCIWCRGRMADMSSEYKIEPEWFKMIKAANGVLPCMDFGWHTGRDSKKNGAFTLFAALAEAWLRMEKRRELEARYPKERKARRRS